MASSKPAQIALVASSGQALEWADQLIGARVFEIKEVEKALLQQEREKKFRVIAGEVARFLLAWVRK